MEAIWVMTVLGVLLAYGWVSWAVVEKMRARSETGRAKDEVMEAHVHNSAAWIKTYDRGWSPEDIGKETNLARFATSILEEPHLTGRSKEHFREIGHALYESDLLLMKSFELPTTEIFAEKIIRGEIYKLGQRNIRGTTSWAIHMDQEGYGIFDAIYLAKGSIVLDKTAEDRNLQFRSLLTEFEQPSSTVH